MAIGRPITFDPEQALDAATQQFWRVGYEATSMQDLLKAMQLSKSSLYQTFGSKKELFHRCLERYTQAFSTEMGVKLENSSNAKSFIEAAFESVLIETSCQQKNGCLLVNTANELGQRDEGIATLVGAGTVKLSQIFERAVIAGQRAGVINQDQEAHALANYLVANICGLRTMVKSGADRESLNKTVAIALSVLG